MARTKQTDRVFLEKPLSSRPCSCNGNNPNCSRCNGLGSIRQASHRPAEDAGYREYMLVANSIAAASMSPGRGRLHKKKLSKKSKKGTSSRSQQPVALSRFPLHDVAAPRPSQKAKGRYVCRECHSEFHALIVYERHQQSCKRARVVPRLSSHLLRMQRHCLYQSKHPRSKGASFVLRSCG
jgi:deoxycytidylate deaminase